MPRLLIGHLVPLNDKLEEDASILKIPLFQGPNYIGRNTTDSLSDKRLSRKYLTLTASADASADASASLVVEGTNPIVIKSENNRKKLVSKEDATICYGDVVELIPGQYIFKYKTLSGNGNEDQHVLHNHKRGLNDGGKATEAAELSRKRSRELVSQDEGSKPNFKAELEGSSSLGAGNLQSRRDGGVVEAIRHFHVPNDKQPQTFRLLKVQGLPEWANSSCASIGNVIQGDILVAILSNYMVDLAWLIPACPKIAKVPHVLVVHGESDGTLDHMKDLDLKLLPLILEKEACKLDSTQTTIAHLIWDAPF